VSDYKNLDHLEKSFVDGRFGFEKEIVVNGIKFKRGKASTYNILDMLSGKKPYVIYAAPTDLNDKIKKTGLNSNIVLFWTIESLGRITPAAARTTTTARLPAQLVREENEKHSIGDTCTVQVLNTGNAHPIDAKVDSGADICSIHAKDISTEDKRVTFTCGHLSDKKCIANIVDTISVKNSDGAVEKRPVISLNIMIDKKHSLKGIDFSLNDREDMDYPILVGKNALNDADLLVDVEPKEEIEVNESDIHKFLDSIEEEVSLNRMEELYGLVKTLKNSRFTFEDMMTAIYTDIAQRINTADEYA
jgi:hypothetical protein